MLNSNGSLCGFFSVFACASRRAPYQYRLYFTRIQGELQKFRTTAIVAILEAAAFFLVFVAMGGGSSTSSAIGTPGQAARRREIRKLMRGDSKLISICKVSNKNTNCKQQSVQTNCLHEDDHHRPSKPTVMQSCAIHSVYDPACTLNDTLNAYFAFGP